MNVLIVEDEGFIALELERITTESGHRALGPAATIEQALAFAPRADVALVDVGLSDGTSGTQLARRLIDRFGISVIFVTGAPQAVSQGFDGAFAVVGKPFSDERIATALQAAEDWRRGHPARASAL
ncbi:MULTISPECIES: response regulator [unclassified Rhizobium]|uniref:response regulator n=1 Tax=unclassified Rhizobium TaxID=2613769 RepID=UPI000DD937EE|nr:response regulator [Rhizobium sp. BG4]QRM45893.1 response regulator [Rhizobium sp. BG4]